MDPRPEDYPWCASLIEAYYAEKAIFDRCRKGIEIVQQQQLQAAFAREREEMLSLGVAGYAKKYGIAIT